MVSWSEFVPNLVQTLDHGRDNVSRVSTELPAWALTQRQLVGDRVRALRSGRGYTQEQLAHAIGVDRKTINRVEQANYGSSIDVYLLVARELGLRMEDLFKGI